MDAPVKMHPLKRARWVVPTTVVAILILALSIVTVRYPQIVQRATSAVVGPRVVVYQSFGGGPAPTKPQLTVYVEGPSGSPATQLQGFATNHVVIDVSLLSNMTTATFDPVTLYVTGTNGTSYRKTYRVTKTSDRLAEGHGREYKIKVSVPPRSGIYTVTASSSQFQASSSKLLVDYGGYFKTGEEAIKLDKKVDHVTLTLTKVIMTPGGTRVLFQGTGGSLLNSIDLATDGQVSVGLGQRHVEGLPSLGFEIGPMAQIRQGEFDFYPVPSDAHQIKLTVLVPTDNVDQMPTPVTFVIPLDH